VRAFNEAICFLIPFRDIKQRYVPIIENKFLNETSFTRAGAASELCSIVCLKEELMFYTEGSKPGYHKQHESQPIFKIERIGIRNKAQPCFNINSSELKKRQLIFKNRGIGFGRQSRLIGDMFCIDLPELQRFEGGEICCKAAGAGKRLVFTATYTVTSSNISNSKRRKLNIEGIFNEQCQPFRAQISFFCQSNNQIFNMFWSSIRHTEFRSSFFDTSRYIVVRKSETLS